MKPKQAPETLLIKNIKKHCKMYTIKLDILLEQTNPDK